MYSKHYRSNIIVIILFTSAILFSEICESQTPGAFPPYTKWYQDPLGLKPLELSSAFGFLWGTTAVAATLVFTKKDAAFLNRMSVYYETGFSIGYKSPYTSVIQNNTGVIYDIRKWMSGGLEWNTFYFKDQSNNTWCIGLRPFARWYPYRSKKAALFFEYGAGLSYSINKFPLKGTGWGADTSRIGTRFNLTSKYGIGVVFNIKERFSLQSGIRHFHLSNGNIVGIQRNPSHDSNGFFWGIIYKLNHN